MKNKKLVILKIDNSSCDKSKVANFSRKDSPKNQSDKNIDNILLNSGKKSLKSKIAKYLLITLGIIAIVTSGLLFYFNIKYEALAKRIDEKQKMAIEIYEKEVSIRANNKIIYTLNRYGKSLDIKEIVISRTNLLRDLVTSGKKAHLIFEKEVIDELQNTISYEESLSNEELIEKREQTDSIWRKKQHSVDSKIDASIDRDKAEYDKMPATLAFLKAVGNYFKQ